MYFHYTNRQGAMAISSCGYLKPSEETGAFGPGVYLTDLDPRGFFRDEILANNYGGINAQFESRADWVVEVLEKNINMHLLRKVNVPGESDRRIFVYPDFILVPPDQIHDKPTCLRGYAIDDYEDGYDESDDESGADGYLLDDEDNESGEFETFENEVESYPGVGREIECYEGEVDENEDGFCGDEANGFECESDENEGNFCAKDEDESETIGFFDGSYGNYDDVDDYYGVVDDYESEDY